MAKLNLILHPGSLKSHQHRPAIPPKASEPIESPNRAPAYNILSISFLAATSTSLQWPIELGALIQGRWGQWRQPSLATSSREIQNLAMLSSCAQVSPGAEAAKHTCIKRQATPEVSPTHRLPHRNPTKMTQSMQEPSKAQADAPTSACW